MQHGQRAQEGARTLSKRLAVKHLVIGRSRVSAACGRRLGRVQCVPQPLGVVVVAESLWWEGAGQIGPQSELQQNVEIMW